MWSRADILGLFSSNVVSFSRNVVLRGLLFSLNSVLKPRMLSVRADYVLSPLHLTVNSHRDAPIPRTQYLTISHSRLPKVWWKIDRSWRAPEPLGDLCEPIRSQGSARVAGIHPGHFAVDLRLLGCPFELVIEASPGGAVGALALNGWRGGAARGLLWALRWRHRMEVNRLYRRLLVGRKFPVRRAHGRRFAQFDSRICLQDDWLADV